MSQVMGASGAESLNVAASIFMGQTEAPLTIRPFLPRMTRSELMTVMTSGMAHISGSIMVAYIAFGIEARHLLTAVIMTAPGTMMMAKLFEPETEVPETYRQDQARHAQDRREPARCGRAGTSEGLNLMLNVIAMLVSFVALVALGQRGLRRDPSASAVVSRQPPDRARLDLPADRLGDGRALARQRDHRRPARHADGAERVHRLLAARSAQGVARSPLLHHRVVRAWPGFANFSSIGIQLGGIGALIPERKRESGSAGLARHAGGHAGELSVGDDRGHAAMSGSERRATRAADGSDVEAAARPPCHAARGRQPADRDRPGIRSRRLRRAGQGRRPDSLPRDPALPDVRR